MTETVRFGLIAKEDLSIGTGSLEARLADGRVVTLTQIRLTDFLSALTLGSVLFVTTGGAAGQNNANFFWDATNLRLGVGTASPTTPLHVVGAILGTTFGPSSTQQHTPPAVASDTFVLLAATQTLSAKTLSSPTFTGTVVGAVSVLDKDVTTADVVSTVAETTVYSFSVPGGTLGTGNALRLILVGDYTNNNGANVLTIRVKYGATTIATFTSPFVANSLNRRPCGFDLMLSANNATNAQVCHGYSFDFAQTQPQYDGATSNIQNRIASGHNAIAIDSTAAQTLVITFQHTVADATVSARALALQLEVLR